MATSADRLHTATGLASNQQRGRGVYASCLWWQCAPRCSIGDSSRALETSRHAAQQKGTLMKCKASVVIQASAGSCAAGPWIWANVASPLFVMVH